MKKNTLLALGMAFVLAFGASAQSARQLIEEKPERAGGVYYAYPTDEIAPDYGSKAPKGYKPFYVSHFGRHGSRYLINDDDYTRLMKVLDKAHAAERSHRWANACACRWTPSGRKHAAAAENYRPWATASTKVWHDVWPRHTPKCLPATPR